MRNRGTIIFVTVVLMLISLYYLSFTVATKRVEKKSVKYADAQFLKSGSEATGIEKSTILNAYSKDYLDSVADKVVYPLLKKYTYRECKERELNLGLDLRGGMNITLEVSAPDIITALVNDKDDATLHEAIAKTDELAKGQAGRNYVNAFGEAYQQVKDQNSKTLAALFYNSENSIKIDAPDAEVLSYLSKEYEVAINSAFEILKNRIDQFGVVQPNIQKDAIAGGVFHLELPGIKDPERVENLLKQAAVLEFWETFSYSKRIKNDLEAANKILSIRKANEIIENIEVTNDNDIIEQEISDNDNNNDNIFIIDEEIEEEYTESQDILKEESKKYSLFDKLLPAPAQIGDAVIGLAKDSDKKSILDDLNSLIGDIFPNDLVLAWSFKESQHAPGYYELYALKSAENTGSVLNGGAVSDASTGFEQTRASAYVSMAMNSEGARKWAQITKNAVTNGNNNSRPESICIAIVLDGKVYSAPGVQNEIKNGMSQITGNFTLSEATDLVNVLKSGKMPATARVLSKEVVGPSLGQKAIDSGLSSFIVAFILVLLYMLLYYGRAGFAADIALIVNVVLIFGVLAAMGAVLTLPGIAGIVLTLGMAVDANVLIFERTREEVRTGKNIKTALSDGFKNAYSAIIDSNLTTILVGIVLFFSGVGTVKGFATTLIIGILTSLFSAIFITRLILTQRLNKNKTISFGNKYTMNAFQNLNLNFISARKFSYIISGGIVVICIVFLFSKGLSQGVDFVGGRNYIVAFQKDVVPEEVAVALEDIMESKPIVKTYGNTNQVKISTKFFDNEKSRGITNEMVDSLLYSGLKEHSFVEASVTLQEFNTNYRQTSQTVESTIADELASKSIIVIIFSLLIMFLYILLRFRKWQYSLAVVASLTHNVIIVLGVFSIFSTMMPFSMEIDQAFIAAILTVVGYSINDTVVIFDRLREFLGLFKKREMKGVINSAINSTIGRTVNTTATTIVVLLAIFIFGGEVIRGFIFAMLIGIIIGIYSSVFIASPIAYDLMKKKDGSN